jgi:signal transduction histidine kinase
VVYFESDLEQWSAGYPLTVFRAALIVPIYAGDQAPKDQTPVGAFGAYTGLKEERDFEEAEWDKKVLGILGHYAALAVMNASRLEALREAQEKTAIAETFAAVGDIASNLLHRLNNKIGTIPVRVQGIQEKSHTSLELDAYLAKNVEEIERSASESMEIVRDSLFHLRPIQFSAVRLADSVAEAVASIHLPGGVHLEQRDLEGLPSVRAGPRRLTLVFVNLLENASEAMGGQGTILISGGQREGWVQVRVADSGPGIPPELHDRIFEFDYSTRSSESPGKLGFGLWWVKTLISRFGGRVWVESDGHTGTAFIFELPQMDKVP